MEQKKKRLSPFSIEHWLAKGYSEEDAEYKRNSFRPIKKEYWVEKGYSEEDAINKATETKTNNNKKGGDASSARTLLEKKEASHRCVEFYLKRGFSEEEAKKQISILQNTFSKKSCIEKYGEEKGLDIWKDRQDRWQETLNSKSQEEKDEMNSKKKNWMYLYTEEELSIMNSSKGFSIKKQLKKGFSKEEIKVQYNNIFGSELYIDIFEFENKVILDIKERPWLSFQNAHTIAKAYTKSQLDILDISDDFFLKFAGKYCGKPYKSKRGYMQLSVDEGLLRSSFEIDFYIMLKDNNIQFKLDKRYSGSNMRYDFYLEDYDLFIEIAPMYNTCEKYKQKMDIKVKLFGSILLRNSTEMKDFIQKLCKPQ